MILRPIEPRDDPALAALIRSSLAAHGLDIPGTVYFDPELDHLSGFYRGHTGRGYFILEDGGALAGGVGGAEYAPRGGCAELRKLYLAGRLKGQGLGYRLLDKAIALARELGYRELYIETHHNLSAAVHLYRKRGFVPFTPSAEQMVHQTMDLFFLKEL